MDNTIDNKQAMKLGYLCGLIDGEGTITIELNKRKNRNLEMYPLICISNSDKNIVKLVEELFNYFDIEYFTFWSKSISRKGYAPNATVRVRGNKRVSKLVSLLKGNLIGKSCQLDIVERFIISRDFGNKRTPYSELEKNLVNNIRLLNLKPSVNNKI